MLMIFGFDLFDGCIENLDVVFDFDEVGIEYGVV